jgi:phage gp46-like protein
MTDVLLYQTTDDGEIDFSLADLVMTDGLETAVYLALFGGNDDDPGQADLARSWWGNAGEPLASQYRSETQYLLRSFPLTSATLPAVEDAARRDLAFLVSEKIAQSVSVLARIPGLNRLSLTVTVDGVDLTFVEEVER